MLLLLFLPPQRLHVDLILHLLLLYLLSLLLKRPSFALEVHASFPGDLLLLPVVHLLVPRSNEPPIFQVVAALVLDLVVEHLENL